MSTPTSRARRSAGPPPAGDATPRPAPRGWAAAPPPGAGEARWRALARPTRAGASRAWARSSGHPRPVGRAAGGTGVTGTVTTGAEASPLAEIERAVQRRAKQLALDVADDGGREKLRALIDDEVAAWSAEYQRGRRTF